LTYQETKDVLSTIFALQNGIKVGGMTSTGFEATYGKIDKV